MSNPAEILKLLKEMSDKAVNEQELWLVMLVNNVFKDLGQPLVAKDIIENIKAQAQQETIEKVREEMLKLPRLGQFGRDRCGAFLDRDSVFEVLDSLELDKGE